MTHNYKFNLAEERLGIEEFGKKVILQHSSIKHHAKEVSKEKPERKLCVQNVVNLVTNLVVLGVQRLNIRA